MFLTFESQDEREKYGGTNFVEFQLCRLPAGTHLKRIVDESRIEYWKDDSLYVSADVDDDFWSAYTPLFSGGVHDNLQSGRFDYFGLNYYDPTLTAVIIQRVLSEKPTDHERLVKWLKKAEACNGFYILGL